MTLPRLVLPDRTLLVTRRCFGRMFLLRPSPQVQAVFTYCLALAAEKYGIQVHAAIVLGNHWHAVLTDPRAALPEFLRWLHTNVAKALNVHHRRGESFWAPGSYSAVHLGDAAAVLDKLAYVTTNAVAAGLVSTPSEWPGLRTLPEDVGVRVLEGARPGFFFRQPSEDVDEDAGDGSARARRRRQEPAREPLPDRARIAVTVPPAFAHLPPDEFRALLGRVVAERVERLHRDRAGRPWLGAQAALLQHPFDSPGSTVPDGGLDPRIACRDKWRRIQLLETQVQFWRDYREALARYRHGERDAVFPEGTYWLRVQFGVTCRAAA
jgi:REP element-mobilizing transposase RayT